MSPEHWTLLLVGLTSVGAVGAGITVVWLQVREMRRESQRFWTGPAGTLIQLWRHLDPEGAARFDQETRRHRLSVNDVGMLVGVFLVLLAALGELLGWWR